MTTPFKKFLLLLVTAVFIVGFCHQSYAQFVENKGQIAHREIKQLRPDIRFQITGGSVISNFKSGGIENYFYKVRETPRENWTEKMLSDERMGRKVRIPKDIFFFRFDVDFLGANPNCSIVPEDKLQSYRNYYYEFCPDGILNVPEYKTIVYKNLYPNIDLKYYGKDGTVKYEFILHKGARISDIRMKISGVKNIRIDDQGNLVYEIAGETMLEKNPYSFYDDNNLEISSAYKLENGNEISFEMPSVTSVEKDLVIDPVLTWSTYFQGVYGGYQNDPGVDDDGNIYICTQEGAGTLPVLNAGGGQWFQGTTTGISPNWDLAIFKFNTDLSLAWCTFYGGLACEEGWGKRNVAVDNVNNIIYFSGDTDTPYSNSTQTFPTYNPGGGAFYQDDSYDNGASYPFFLAFNPSGVRQWATLFTYETPPFSGGMGTQIQSIYFMNGYLYFAGETNKYSHNGFPLRTLAGAYNNSYYCGGDVPFVGRFTTSYSLQWCTYINAGLAAASFSTSCIDMVVDPNNNIYVLNDYSEYSGSGISNLLPLVNPGSGAYYQSTAASFGTSRRGNHITKLNPASSSVLWGTFFQGSTYTGSWPDFASCLAIDGSNNLLVGFRGMYSSDFPTTNPGGGALYQATRRSTTGSDGGIARFSSAGVKQWATYMNGSTQPTTSTGVYDVDVYPDNSFVITGNTAVSDFYLQNVAGSYYKGTITAAGTTEGFFTKFSNACAIQWSTYFPIGYGYGAITSTPCAVRYVVDNSGGANVPLVNPGSPAYYSSTMQNYQSFQVFEDVSFTPSVAATSINASPAAVCSGSSTTLSVNGGSLGTGASWHWYSGSCGGTPVGTGSSISVSPSSTTTYFVRAESVCGNSSCTSQTVTVNPNASIASVSGASPLCAGATTTYSANSVVLSGGTGSWSSSNNGIASVNASGVVTGNAGGSCNIIYTITGGCGGTVSQQQSITITPTASIASVSGSSPLCIGASANYTANSVVLGGGTGAWTSGNSGIASVNASGSVTGVSAGSTNIIYTITGGCGGTVSQQQGVTINPNASIASVSGSSPLCIGASTNYSANSVVLGGGTGAWSSGNSGIASVNGAGNVTGVTAGSTNIIYTITGGCGGTVSQQQGVTINPNASIASVSGISPLCIGASTNYSANSVVLGGGTGAWSSGNSGIASVNAAGNVTGVSAGSTNIIYTITGGCGGTVSQQQGVTINPNASIASVSGSSPLCIGSTTNYSANSAVLGGGTGAWSSGNSGIASVNAAGIVTGVTAGSTNIIYTITGGCGGTVSQQQGVTINPNASIASVSGSSPLCIGASTNYSANSVVLGGGTGAWSSGNSGIASVNASGSVTGVTAGSTNIIYTITGGCGGTVSQQQGVTINPNASIASVSGSSPLCIGASTNYSANSVVLSGGTGAWSSGNSGIASVNAAGSVTGVSAGSTNIIYTITGGCGGTVSQQQGVTINPNASIASVSGSSPLCIGNSANYTANSVVLGGGTGAWSSGNSGIASVNASGSVTGNTAGSTNIIYTITGGCGGTVSQQQSVTITPNASIASVSGSSPLCPGNSTTYTANSVVTGGGTGAWSSGNNSIATVNSSGLVNAMSSGTTNIIYTITGGCGGTQSAQQSITVSPAAPATPGAITGSATACPGSNGLIYSISNVPDATTYTWTVPTGWSINAGAGTNSISVTAGAAGQNGTITVTAGNSCGTSTSSTLNVTVSTVVAASVSISPSANPVCEGTSVTFTANPVNGGSTPVYQWYLNGSPTGSNSSTFSSSSLTNLNQVYCIMTSSEACATGSPYTSNTVIMNINSLSLAPTSINTTVNPVCPGGSSLLTVQGGSLGTGANWEWYEGSCSGTHLGSGSSINVTPSANTDYFVLAQGTCNTTSCVNTSITVTPVSATASTDQTICTGDSVLISVSGTGSFSWTPGGQTSASFYVKPGTTTTYTVTAVNGSCNASDAVTVNVTNAADASITAAGPYCTGQSPVTLTAADPGGVWSGSGITNASTGIFSPASAGTGSHQIIYTISGSCGAADTVMITVNPSVDASINAAGPFCSNATPVTLSAANPGGVWSGPGITNTSSGLFNPAISGSGTFNIIYTISGACGGADTTSIVVNPAHNASINPSGPYCVTESPVFLSSYENGGVWSGNGITNTTTGSFDPAIAGAGNHEIIYTIAGSCGDSDTVNILVNALANTQITSTGPYCSNIGVFDLSAATTGGIWSGAGITNTSTGSFNPLFAGVGTHTIIYLITGACGNSDTISLTVLPSPTAYATATDESCINKADGSATVSGSGGTAPYTFLWETSETTGNISGLTPGQYTVILTDANGCQDPDTVNVLAATSSCETVIPVVYVPNIFTPNGDGNNDVLFVRGQGITEFSLRIYDRWGEKVFETTDLSQGWDGKFRGKDVDQGVFVYTLYVLFADGSETKDKGNITMTR